MKCTAPIRAATVRERFRIEPSLAVEDLSQLLHQPRDVPPQHFHGADPLFVVFRLARFAANARLRVFWLALEEAAVFLVAGQDMGSPPFGEEVGDSDRQVPAAIWHSQRRDPLPVAVMLSLVIQVARVASYAEHQFLSLQMPVGIIDHPLKRGWSELGAVGQMRTPPQLSEQFDQLAVLDVQFGNANAAFLAPLEWVHRRWDLLPYLSAATGHRNSRAPAAALLSPYASSFFEHATFRPNPFVVRMPASSMPTSPGSRLIAMFQQGDPGTILSLIRTREQRRQAGRAIVSRGLFSSAVTAHQQR
jgi:hypothetical protein